MALTFSTNLGALCTYVFLTFQMSEEIIPPSGDEDSSGSEFFSSFIKSQKPTEVLNPDLEQNETNGDLFWL